MLLNAGLGYLLFLLPGILAAFIAHKKHRSMAGWSFLCIIFPFALIVLFLMGDKNELKKDEDSYEPCPYCKEPIRKDAVLCRFCRMPINRDKIQD